jgi:lipopolysaccharide transport system ATP-binding protein
MGSITVSNLGKAYKQYPTRWSRLAEWLSPFRKSHHNLKWVLQDINFTVKPGESVGIIGINGAGKSTLLKMITGTTQPTTGSVHVAGRVAALLELGMGFHPDFTGRQNAFMAGQLLGYSIEDISRLMPEIEAFAEIGDYIDQPVRVYSSGMQVRLAFSVATMIRPDILIVDEALSVGDAYFQAKCYQRVAHFKDLGTTLILVTHSIGDVVKHCNRALFIKAGRLELDGSPRDVSNLYMEALFGKAQKRDGNEIRLIKSDESFVFGTEDIFHTRFGYRKEEHRWGNGGAKILDYLIRANGQDYPPIIESNTNTEFYFNVSFEADYNDITAGFLIKTHDGIFLYGTNSFLASKGQLVISAKKGQQITFKFILPMTLNAGHYMLSFGIATGSQESLLPLDRRYDSVLLTVERPMGFWGLVDLQADFDFKTEV